MLWLDKLLFLGRILSYLNVDFYLLPIQKVAKVLHLIRLWIGQVEKLAIVRPGQELAHLRWVVAADGAEGRCWGALLRSHLRKHIYV